MKIRIESYEDVQATGLPAGTVVDVPDEIVAEARRRVDAEYASATKYADKCYEEDLASHEKLAKERVKERHCSRAKAIEGLERSGLHSPRRYDPQKEDWRTRAVLMTREEK